MGQSQIPRSQGAVDTVITNALVEMLKVYLKLMLVLKMVKYVNLERQETQILKITSI